MSELLLSKDDQAMLELLADNPPQALALVGPPGFGKGYIANLLAQKIVSRKGDVININNNQQTIKIDAIRRLRSHLNFKTKQKRVVVIEDAQLMTNEAQNAFLKTLEEPNENIVFIMTVSAIQGLLPTIISRIRLYNLHAISNEDAVIFFKNKGFKKHDIDKAYAISGGCMGLMTELLTDSSSMNEQIELSKKILSLGLYQRLLLIDSIAKDKDRVMEFIYVLKRILKTSARININNQNQVERIISAQKATLRAEEAILHNSNVKLALLNLFLRL